MDNPLGIKAIEPGELEIFVSSAEPSCIDLIGSKNWVEWHHRFQKLHQQAVLEAASSSEELTKDALISHGKAPLLVHEAICISIWRQKIFPKILELDPDLSHTFLLYAVLYHETVAVGLLEIILFDEEACCAMADILVDIIDYSIEMISSLIGLVNCGYLEYKGTNTEPSEDVIKELLTQQKDLQFDIAIRCLTIISGLSQVMDKIHVSASSRLYESHDTPLLLAQMLAMEPWQKLDKDGNTLQYIQGKWTCLNPDDTEINRAETMCWLALWRLLLNPDLHNHYEITNSRKTDFCKETVGPRRLIAGAAGALVHSCNEPPTKLKNNLQLIVILLKLLYKITDSHMDQLPLLAELKRFLGQLALMDTSSPQASTSRPLLVEVVPQIKPSIMKRIHKKSKVVAKSQLQYFFKPDKTELKELATVLSSSYASEVLEHMDDGGAKCALCGQKAAKRCSHCMNEWYCGRVCQVKRWPNHKDICRQLAAK